MTHQRPAPNPAALDEERLLIGRVQRGDTAAFDSLVRRHLPRALATAVQVVGDRHDAEDVVQDAFIRALRYIRGFDTRQPFVPWLHRLVVNTALDARARRAREVTEPERGDAASPAVSPHLALERQEVRDRFAVALAALSPRQRLILARFEVDGLSTAEIARELEIAPETVRWHLHQARHALRAPLGVLRDVEAPRLRLA
ncbi:MAG: RNA polymerase sigma factor [Gemmatimonadaceae bacterium]|nr:RNA polymerase sigma factor [Gemmatimonadaceae bacterium]